MGFWKRVFGADEVEQGAAAPVEETRATAEAAAPASAADPYREGGAAPPPSPPRAKKRRASFTPIWDNTFTDVLALEAGGDGEAPVRAVCYDGDASGDYRVVRRVSFQDGEPAVDWEVPLPDLGALSDHYVCRVEDRVLVPRAAGLVAVHVETGEPCWELPHPARLHYPPRMTSENELLLVFADQTWTRVAPRDGSFVAEGRVRTEEEAEKLRERTRPLVRLGEMGRRVRVGAASVELGEGGLEVSRGKRGGEGAPTPSPGTYPIDEWSTAGYLALIDETLVVSLRRSWGNRTRVALGLIEPISLEPLRLLELADGHIGHVELLDGLLVLRGSFQREDDSFGGSFVVDVGAQRVLACFAEEHACFQFDSGGGQLWSGRL